MKILDDTNLAHFVAQIKQYASANFLALHGKADSAGVADKVGTTTVGSSRHPVYIKAGVPTEITITAGTTGTYHPLITVNDSGSFYKTSGITVNYATNDLKATTFTGALKGNADTATKLATARSLWGVSFDGSADLTTTPDFYIGTTKVQASSAQQDLSGIGTLEVAGYAKFADNIRLSSGHHIFGLQGADEKSLLSFSGDATNNELHIGYGEQTHYNITTYIHGKDVIFRTATDSSHRNILTMILKNDGKVGIGTDSPAARLDVSGGIIGRTGVASGGISDPAADTEYLPLSGGSLTGDIDINGAPVMKLVQLDVIPASRTPGLIGVIYYYQPAILAEPRRYFLWLGGLRTQNLWGEITITTIQ